MPRNSSGTYTLPAGNPVAPNTIIETAWANPTMSDIGAAITDSLDRFGRGSMLAPIKSPDGAFNAPVFSFVAEATMGMYRESPGVLGFAIGGTIALLLSATAAVFDPLVAPTWAADPGGPDQLTRKSYVDAAISGAGYLPLTGGTLAGPGNLRVDGKLTMGTASTANALLEIVGSAPATAELLLRSSSGVPAAQGVSVVQGGNDAYVYNRHPSGLMFLGTANTARVTIAAAGDIGIGVTPTPVGSFRKLDISGTGGALIDLFAGATLRGRIAASPTAFTFDSGVTPTPIGFYIGGVEKVTIDAAGNVGMGLTTPGVTGLAVGNPARTGESFIRNVTSTNDMYWGQSSGVIFGFATGTIGVLVQNASVPLGIGTIAAQPLVFGTATAERGRFSSTGNFTVGGVMQDGKINMQEFNTTGGPWLVSANRGPNFTHANIYEVGGYYAEGFRDVLDPAYIAGIAFERTPTNSGASSGGSIVFKTDNIGVATKAAVPVAMRITSLGVIQDGAGLELGYRSLNRVTYNSGASVLAQSDNGKCHYKQDATNVTVNTGLTDGTIITVYNASGTARTIVQGAGMTLLLAGTATTGNRTLAPNGICTVWIVATTAVISGTGLS